MTVIEMQTMEAIKSMARSIENINKSMQPKEIDWEQRRYEIAKDLLAAQVSNGPYSVKESVSLADKLIAELKKEV